MHNRAHEQPRGGCDSTGSCCALTWRCYGVGSAACICRQGRVDQLSGQTLAMLCSGKHMSRRLPALPLVAFATTPFRCPRQERCPAQPGCEGLLLTIATTGQPPNPPVS